MKTPFIIAVILIFSWLFSQAACSRKKGTDGVDAKASAGGAATNDADRSRAQALVESGKELYRTDQDEKATATFEEAVRLDPDFAEAYFRLGLSYDALGKESEAQEAYKKSIEKYKKHLDAHSKDAEAHYNLGQAYAGLRLYTEAVREYRQATRLKSDDADMYYDLGVALTKLANYDEAAAAFSKSLEIDPENYRAEDALEEAREGVKRINAGKKHQEDLLKKQKKADESDNANGSSTNSNNANSSRSNSNTKSNSNSKPKPKPTRKPGTAGQ